MKVTVYRKKFQMFSKLNINIVIDSCLTKNSITALAGDYVMIPAWIVLTELSGYEVAAFYFANEKWRKWLKFVAFPQYVTIFLSEIGGFRGADWHVLIHYQRRLMPINNYLPQYARLEIFNRAGHSLPLLTEESSLRLWTFEKIKISIDREFNFTYNPLKFLNLIN